MLETDVNYFSRGEAENPKFWSRLGGEPCVRGLKVLDVGCGHGSLCVDIANKSAKQVVGIDINKDIINFANINVSKNYPNLNNLEFRCCDILGLPKSYKEFDIIVSKSSLEHMFELDKVLYEMKDRLRCGGKIYIGFGPLYKSPYGDHGINKEVLFGMPWGHLFFPEKLIVKLLNKKSDKKINSIFDRGLNKLSLEQYKQVFNNSVLNITYFRVNVGNSPITRIFSLMRHIPLISEYFSYNVYCVLEKK